MTLTVGEPAFAGPQAAAGTTHNTIHKAVKTSKSQKTSKTTTKTIKSADTVHFGHYIAGTPEAMQVALASPPAPGSVKAVAVHNTIAVSWPLVDGANHYVAMTSPAGGQCTTTANSCGMLDVPDNTYTVYVVAYGTAGTDSPSAVSPGSPQITTITQGVAGTPPVATHSQTPGPMPTTPYPAMNPVPTQTVTFPGTTPFPTSQPITPFPGVGGVNSVPTNTMPTTAPGVAPTFVMPPVTAPTMAPTLVIPPTAPTFPGLTPAPTFAIPVPAPTVGTPGLPLFPGMSTGPTVPGTTPAPTFAVPVPVPTAVVVPTAAPTFVFPTAAPTFVMPTMAPTFAVPTFAVPTFAAPTYVAPTAIPTFPTSIPTPAPTFPVYAPMPTVAPGFPGLGNLIPVAPAPAPGTILLPSVAPTMLEAAVATPTPQPPLVLPMLPPSSGATAGAIPSMIPMPATVPTLALPGPTLPGTTLPPLPLPSGGPTSPPVPQPQPSVTTFPVAPVVPVTPGLPVVPVTPVLPGGGAPSSPLSVTATPYTANGAKVSWTAPASAGTGISHYTVMSQPGALTCDTPDANTTSCTVMGLANGTTYTFVAFASGTAGNSAASQPSGPVAISAIDAPAAVMLTPGDGRLTVSWSTPTTGNAGITGYSATANPGAVNCSTTDPSQLSCVLTGLTNGVMYTVTVVAHKSGGVADSPASPALNGTPGVGAVTTPTPTPTVSAGALQSPTAVAAAGGVGVIGVAWNPSTSSGVAHYTATVSPGGQSCSTADNTVSECLITGLTGGTPYTVTVVAVGQDGSTSLPSTPYGPVTPTQQ